MKRMVLGLWKAPTGEETSSLILVSVFFAVGSLFGCFLAFRASQRGGEALSVYLERFLSAAQDSALTAPSLFSVIWRSLRWLLGAFLCGFTALGLLGIPVLSWLRGFLLSFSVASFARLYGHMGLRLAFVLLGLTGLVCVPVFFLLTTQSFAAARRLAAGAGGQGRLGRLYGFDYFLRFGLGLGAILVCVLMEYYGVPLLVGRVVQSLLT